MIDCGVLIVFGLAMAFVWFKISDFITPIRVSRETEIQGLDIPEMGVHGYPEFTGYLAESYPGTGLATKTNGEVGKEQRVPV